MNEPVNEPTIIQSTLEPALGSPADTIHDLSTTLHVGAATILLLISFLALYGVIGKSRKVRARRWLIGGGIVFPVVTLVALFVYALAIGNRLEAHGGEDVVRIHVVGKQWWWQVSYPPRGEATEPTVLANELHVPVGQPVEITLGTDDVIHSFWIPSLAGKVDMVPGRTNHLILRAGAPGVFRGQCAEYCGAQHALMAFFVVVEPAAQFEAWLDHQALPATPVAEDPQSRLGQELFFRGGCATCHAIRGTAASGTLGPDLTHVGSRRSLAAGTLRNHVGAMAGWIAGAQDVKPASLMPSAETFSGPELRALSAYLVSLK